MSLYRLGSSEPHKDLYKGPLALRRGDKWRRKGGDKRDPRAGNASLWVWEARWRLFSQSHTAATELGGGGPGRTLGGRLMLPWEEGRKLGSGVPTHPLEATKERSLCKVGIDITPHYDQRC